MPDGVVFFTELGWLMCRLSATKVVDVWRHLPVAYDNALRRSFFRRERSGLLVERGSFLAARLTGAHSLRLCVDREFLLTPNG